MPSYDVCVIGLGRIGLPLALSFADAGLSVLGVDNDTKRLDTLRERRMPFKEPGTDELLARVDLDLSPRAADAAQADAIVLTLGTPAMSHIEIDIGAIRAVLDDLLPLVRPEQLIVLRSTVRRPECASEEIGASELLSSCAITRMTFFHVSTSCRASSRVICFSR